MGLDGSSTQCASGNNSMAFHLKTSTYLEKFPLPLVEWGCDMAITEWNYAAEKLFGYKKEDVFEAQSPESDAPWALRYCIAKLRKLVSSGAKTGELRRRRGLSLFLDIYIAKSDGEAAGAVSIFNDVTAGRRMERAIRESGLLYRNTIENMRDAVFVVDRDLKITLFNHSFIDFCSRLNVGNFSAGSRLDELFPFFSSKIADEYNFVFRNGKVLDSEDNIFTDDGILIISETKIPILDASGHTERIITVASDITKRRKSEEMVKSSEASLNAIFENSESMIFSVDAAMHYKKFNHAFSETVRKYFGYAPTVGSRMLGNMADNHKKIFLPILERALKGERFSKEISVDINGSAIWLESWFSPIVQDGELGGFAAIVNNTTQKKKLEKEAEIHRQQIIQADKMISLGILVSGIAHEINNPNNSIAMNVPLIQRAWKSLEPIIDAYGREHGDFSVGGLPYSEMKTLIPSLFEGIKGGSERIKNIVSGLKDYSKQDSGMPKTQVDINGVVDQAVIILCSLIRKATDQFLVKKRNDLPPIYASAQKIEQVLINLVQNSCAALGDSRGRLEIRTDYDPQSDRVVLIVEDEGSGIGSENLKYVKDPFFTTRRDSGGTGLGLSISTGIVEDYHGELLIESKLGKGTIVSVKIPSYKKTFED
ncbi:MAG: hypothetical protein A2020_11720 [Lentisphaerae bacterium GWF2_45_14]|nr:MAG: hypothetical protein A2020_11720 [Lentisphaerae bacterium GWF2_45_14]